MLGFGKKRRSVKKVSSKKPSSKLLKLCKRYKVKATSKGKYRSTLLLKKECLKKALAMLKKAQKLIKKTKFGAHKSSVDVRNNKMVVGKHVSFGKMMEEEEEEEEEEMEFGRRARFGAPCGGNGMMGASSFGKKRRDVGKKTSKAAAMKAFRSLYNRHCARSMKFGSGGNPSLASHMGAEFCSNGGGVLGASSTGLFYTPCMNEVVLSTPSSAFGKRRKVRKVRKGSKKPSKAVLKMCKKLKIKATLKRGGKRVYKSVSVLKKLIKMKVRKMKMRKMKMRKMRR